jgi:hypothetical protein
MSPLAGGVATSSFLTLRCIVEGQTYSIMSAFLIWLARDTIIAYVLALPALLGLRRLGVIRVLPYVITTMILAVPMGYVLANPVDYAWAPTDQDFEHGPYWLLMCAYMACWSFTGLAFCAGRQPAAR